MSYVHKSFGKHVQTLCLYVYAYVERHIILKNRYLKLEDKHPYVVTFFVIFLALQSESHLKPPLL
jgi:hypothetical protein